MLKSKFNTLNIVTTAMLCCIAVVLARVFHSLVGNTVANLFSIMHLPVLLTGILCGATLGAIGGAVVPVISFLISGMPSFPDKLVPMVLELACYGFFSGLMSKLIATTSLRKFSSVVALAVAMVCGRVINALCGALFMSAGGTPYLVNFVTKLGTNFTSTWLGMLLQLVTVPCILYALKRANVLHKYVEE